MVSAVVSGLVPAGTAWMQRVAYEVAIEGTGHAIAFYAELIANEEATENPDREGIGRWRAEQRAWADRRRVLSPADTKEIDTIYSEGEVLLAEPDAGKAVTEDLSADENERIFRERIVPDELSATPQEQPVAVIVVGQPGDGKPAVSALARAALMRQGRDPVTIAADRYQPHWPVLRTPIDDGPANDATTDGLEWMAKALTYARSHQLDVVMETPVLTPEDVAAFSSAGYRVEVAILAVPAAASRLGVLDRHLRTLEVYGFGRLVDPEVHDTAYRRVLDVAELLENEQCRVTVLRPDGQVIHQEAAGTAEAIERERSRPWTPAESRQFLDGIAEVRRIGRSAPIEWIQREADVGERMLRTSAAPYLHPDAVTMHIATAGVSPPDVEETVRRRD
ncbi:hypothetical protein E1218_34950 [Kribbella turkmenica]|uniref:UDP-N-acetylglucosamine kinase n=1 Tax=Kribbella turkmenica TaxID=2530375 RepID=A0A4R4W7X8_9ACTN|nr:zeta toxin family protein [Kribbella turkmenica]TDD13117.1 hypothetical protein E1218_34950 [Kribbella turkmenica]